jgi:hypothetical protein
MMQIIILISIIILIMTVVVVSIGSSSTWWSRTKQNRIPKHPSPRTSNLSHYLWCLVSYRCCTEFLQQYTKTE